MLTCVSKFNRYITIKLFAWFVYNKKKVMFFSLYVNNLMNFNYIKYFCWSLINVKKNKQTETQMQILTKSCVNHRLAQQNSSVVCGKKSLFYTTRDKIMSVIRPPVSVRERNANKDIYKYICFSYLPDSLKVGNKKI